MAGDFSKKKKEQLDYAAEVQTLKKEGPGRLYLLYGEEDYLREQYYHELEKLCATDDDGFNRHRLDGPALDLRALDEAVNALPFFAEHTMVEIWNFDLNKCRDAQAETLKKMLADIPEYCTVIFVQSSAYEIDARMGVFKTIKKLGKALNFTAQGQGQILSWITRRFAALGKQIGRREAEHLVFLSGSLMNALIPEIEKIAGYTQGDTITMADVDAVAHHLPEAVIFEMTDALSARKYDRAAEILSELLQMRDENAIRILAMIGQQMRNLYAARIALDSGKGKRYLMETCHVGYDFIAEKLLRSAKGFTAPQLADAVAACADCDYAMKSSGDDERELLKALLIRIAVGRCA